MSRQTEFYFKLVDETQLSDEEKALLKNKYCEIINY